MCTYYDSFRVKAKGITYERVHTDIGLYMCVHIIHRYDDTMREKGGEGRERKKRDIHIYINLQGWPPPVCGVVSMRQRALLLYARVFYTCTYLRTHTLHMRARTSAREYACTFT